MNVQKRITDEETKELQKYILDILLAIDKVCREHNLTYYLIAGTMLGAVRHKGFVPWDDDADVALPRKDYNILVKHANEWLPKRYELVSGRTLCIRISLHAFRTVRRRTFSVDDSILWVACPLTCSHLTA